MAQNFCHFSLFTMEDRKIWKKCFQEIGINEKEMLSMNEEEFITKCNFCFEAGIAPDIPKPKPSNPPPKPRKNPISERTPSSIIRHDQDEEYRRAQEEERLRQIAERKAQEEEKVKPSVGPVKKGPIKPVRIITREEYKELARRLPPPPDKGILLAFTLPNSKRITRKFNDNTMGKDLFTFISGEDALFNEKNELLKFDIVLPVQGSLLKNQTLRDQNIENRMMLNVVLDD